jgi:ribonuclease BN (tRNA processing enzyme)
MATIGASAGGSGSGLRPHITVISAGRNGTGFSMMVSVDNDRAENVHEITNFKETCLVNVGDSCQLLASTMKLKLKTVRHIFLTSLAPHNCSGLPAVLLSMSDMVITMYPSISRCRCYVCCWSAGVSRGDYIWASWFGGVTSQYATLR